MQPRGLANRRHHDRVTSRDIDILTLTPLPGCAVLVMLSGGAGLASGLELSKAAPPATFYDTFGVASERPISRPSRGEGVGEGEGDGRVWSLEPNSRASDIALVHQCDASGGTNLVRW